MIETDIFDALETTAEIMKVEFSVNLAQLPEKNNRQSVRHKIELSIPPSTQTSQLRIKY